MKNINIEIPDGFELQKTSEGNYKVVPHSNPDLSIINDTDWFYIEDDANLIWLVKGNFYKAKKGNIAYCLVSKRMYKDQLFLKDLTHIKLIRLATPEEIEDFYETYPQYRPEPIQKKWEDFGKIEGYYINILTNIVFYNTYHSLISNKNVFPTSKEAESALALSQLLQWRDKANGEKLEDWCDWSNGNINKFGIIRDGKNISTFDKNYFFNPLVFKTKEIRDQFMIDHKDLLEQYFMIKKN